MAVSEQQRAAPTPPDHAYPHAVNVGPIGRLGRFTATHFRVVAIAWLIVAVGLGFFAPRVETRCRAPAGRPPARNRCRRDS